MLAVRYQTPTMRDLRFTIFLAMPGDGVEDVTELLAFYLQSDFCLFLLGSVRNFKGERLYKINCNSINIGQVLCIFAKRIGHTLH